MDHLLVRHEGLGVNGDGGSRGGGGVTVVVSVELASVSGNTKLSGTPPIGSADVYRSWPSGNVDIG